MTQTPEIRETQPADWPALQQLYPAVFSDEDLLPVVEQLLVDRQDVVSLGAWSGETLSGHVAFTLCGVEGSTEQVGLLGPLGVSPNVQKQGIGEALVHEGLKRLKARGASLVLVLGDPKYYGRFGFEADADIAPPYLLPEEYLGAWQSLCLTEENPSLYGMLSVPSPWQQPALWVE